MSNNVDTRLQRTNASVGISGKSVKESREKDANTSSTQMSRAATTRYLNSLSRQQDDVGDTLSRSMNKLNQSLSHAASSNEEVAVDEQAEKMAVYTKLAGKIISRDANLQDKVAHNLSSGSNTVRSKDAVDSLQQAMSKMPSSLKEGTQSGKDLAKFMVENLVTLTDTKNMGAGLERDLAVRQITVPKHAPNSRVQAASDKVLQASIEYIKSNQLEALAKEAAQAKSGQSANASSTNSTANVNLNSSQDRDDAEVANSTYTQSIIKQRRDAQNTKDVAQQNTKDVASQSPQDRISSEISKRIHSLISQAAASAKQGNLIQLTPEEAKAFDKAASTPSNSSSVERFLTKTTTSAPEAPLSEGKARPAIDNTNVRQLSLSELSARASKLQQEFRTERHRIAQEGKLPDPAQMTKVEIKVDVRPSQGQTTTQSSSDPRANGASTSAAADRVLNGDSSNTKTLYTSERSAPTLSDTAAKARELLARAQARIAQQQVAEGNTKDSSKIATQANEPATKDIKAPTAQNQQPTQAQADKVASSNAKLTDALKNISYSSIAEDTKVINQLKAQAQALEQLQSKVAQEQQATTASKDTATKPTPDEFKSQLASSNAATKDIKGPVTQDGKLLGAPDKAPASSDKAPVADKTPVADKAPVDNKAPVTDKTPIADKAPAASSDKVIAQDNKLPGAPDKAPVASDKAPVTKDIKVPVPPQEGKLPGAPDKAPTADKAPVADKAPAASSDKVIAQDNKLPGAPDKTPVTKDIKVPVPPQDGKLPGAPEKAPIADKAPAASSDKVIAQDNKLPGAPDKAPVASDKAPVTKDIKVPVPPQDGKLPGAPEKAPVSDKAPVADKAPAASSDKVIAQDNKLPGAPDKAPIASDKSTVTKDIKGPLPEIKPNTIITKESQEPPKVVSNLMTKDASSSKDAPSDRSHVISREQALKDRTEIKAPDRAQTLDATTQSKTKEARAENLKEQQLKNEQVVEKRLEQKAERAERIKEAGQEFEEFKQQQNEKLVAAMRDNIDKSAQIAANLAAQGAQGKANGAAGTASAYDTLSVDKEQFAKIYKNITSVDDPEHQQQLRSEIKAAIDGKGTVIQDKATISSQDAATKDVKGNTQSLPQGTDGKTLAQDKAAASADQGVLKSTNQAIADHKSRTQNASQEQSATKDIKAPAQQQQAQAQQQANAQQQAQQQAAAQDAADAKQTVAQQAIDKAAQQQQHAQAQQQANAQQQAQQSAQAQQQANAQQQAQQSAQAQQQVNAQQQAQQSAQTQQQANAQQQAQQQAALQQAVNQAANKLHHTGHNVTQQAAQQAAAQIVQQLGGNANNILNASQAMTGMTGNHGSIFMPGAAGFTNMTTLDEETLQDEIIKNVMHTVPSDELDEFSLRGNALGEQALSGVVADTDLNGLHDHSLNQLFTAGITDNGKGDPLSTFNQATAAAQITTGQNAPIPAESNVTSSTAKESGLLRRLASFFSRKEDGDMGPVDATGKPIDPSKAALNEFKSGESSDAKMSQNVMQNNLRMNSLDTLIHRLQSAISDQALPPKVQEQAQNLMKALNNPVSDLSSVSSWLNFVTGPMSPSSPQAVAMHQWAFMLLCIRFEQIGKNIDKFLKKHGGPEKLAKLEPAIKEHKALAQDMDDTAINKSHELLKDTFTQVERMQQNQTLSQDQAIPRYIPLPPNYEGGKEGSMSARKEQDSDGGTSWHLNFKFDLENMGALHIKVKLRFPEIQMSFVAERFETLQKVQSLMPDLNAKLKEIGLTSTGSSARLGSVSFDDVISSDGSSSSQNSSFKFEGNAFNAEA